MTHRQIRCTLHFFWCIRIFHFASELKAGSRITAALPTPTLLSHSSLSLRTRLRTGTQNEMAARLLRCSQSFPPQKGPTSSTSLHRQGGPTPPRRFQEAAANTLVLRPKTVPWLSHRASGAHKPALWELLLSKFIPSHPSPESLAC